MKQSLKYLFIIIFLGQALSSMAQQDQLYITYPFMPLNVNPAYAGSREVISIAGIYRKRPLFGALGVATTTQQYFNFDMPIAKDKMAIGFQAYNAEQALGNGTTGGVLGNLGLYGDFAYRFTLPNDGKLAIGVQAGVTQVPAFISTSGGGVGSTNFNSSLGGGIYYNNDDAYLGVSMLNFNATDSYNRPLFVTAGYVFTIDDDFKIKTGALVRKQSSNIGGKTSIDLNATGWINDKFGIGVWYQNTGSELSNNAFLASFQVQLKKFQIGYAYDFAKSNSTALVGNEGFHQIMVRYEMDSGNGKSGVFRYF
ncbi:type IX secretion system PorP/SprF family membrane protein [Arcicella aurantiaca]|uniref:Type IX secretion system PorP/SprF family membrane protein n=1 Tax=Arcicella aurantiaca TaxID=591202 RepID=A0A316DF31_9BACT|nr:PorP/SprF family type IX secretion system membrane protein [Arcicella aurantiaca]PWK16867.1 type IX secretion system PorP/SprF family membrane protein [Arcicella aurantiaca]